MKKVISIFLILVTLFMVGCSNKAPKQVAAPKNTPVTMPSGLSLEEINSNVKFAINKGLWENTLFPIEGNMDPAKTILGKNINYKIYNNSKEKYIFVLFTKKYKSSDGTIMYFSINLNYNKYGIESLEAFTDAGVMKLGDVNSVIKHSDFLGTGNFIIDKITKPDYPPASPLKKRILKNLEKKVFEGINNTAQKKGNYKVYIVNFLDGDFGSKVYVKDEEGNIYVGGFRGELINGEAYDIDYVEYSLGRYYSKNDRFFNDEYQEFKKSVFIKVMNVKADLIVRGNV